MILVFAYDEYYPNGGMWDLAWKGSEEEFKTLIENDVEFCKTKFFNYEIVDVTDLDNDKRFLEITLEDGVVVLKETFTDEEEQQ